MHLRSWLLTPGDSAKKLEKAAATGADVIVIDLECSVAPAKKALAREQAAAWLAIHRTQILENRKLGRWVRINAIDSRMWRDDVIAVMAGAPDGIILPKSAGPASIQHLASEIYELEQRHGVASGSTRILPVVSGTAHAALTINSYVDASMPRLAGLGWDADALAAALGASRQREPGVGWSDPFRLARGQTLLAAHARGEIALETPHGDAADLDGMKLAAVAARADGFTGMMAIHPAQVPVINAAFTPTEAEIAEARAIMAAFNGDPEIGALQFDRRTIDKPQLRLARRRLGLD